MAKTRSERKVASMRLHGIALGHPKVRKDVVAWLRKLAAALDRKPADYAPNFRAGLTYVR